MEEPLLSYSEVEETLESILINKTLAQIDALDGLRFVIFSHPTTEETIISRQVRKRALYEAQKDGLPTRSDVEKFINSKKILTDADQAKINDLESRIVAQRRLLQITKIEGRRKPIEETISKFSAEIEAIKGKVNRLFYMSAETKADEEVILYLSWASSYNLDGEKYWPTFADFENERDLHFRTNLIDAFSSFNRGLTTKIIRFVARHSLWRIRYAAALRVGGALFCRELYDLTTDQLSLIYWTNYYQNIYELMPDDRPDDNTINNDVDLDAYMESLAKRREEERNEGRVKRRAGASKKGKLSAWDRGEEIIITAAHPEYMNMVYSERRVKANNGASDVEVVSPNSKRARNKRSVARRNR